jgi:hypothetical protein
MIYRTIYNRGHIQQLKKRVNIQRDLAFEECRYMSRAYNILDRDSMNGHFTLKSTSSNVLKLFPYYRLQLLNSFHLYLNRPNSNKLITSESISMINHHLSFIERMESDICVEDIIHWICIKKDKIK